jgi:hypothetical protein
MDMAPLNLSDGADLAPRWICCFCTILLLAKCNLLMMTGEAEMLVIREGAACIWSSHSWGWWLQGLGGWPAS